MLNKNQIKNLANTINTMPFNTRAEVLVALLLEQGISPEQMTIHFNSAFNRPFRRDVEKALAGLNDEANHLNVFLSRNGIYDLLPEGMTHSRNDGQDSDTNDIIQQHQKQKKEEKDARLFFRPFENELFNILIKLEQQECDLLKNSESYFQKFLAKFWNINPELTGNEIRFLLRVAPLSHSIKGDLTKTAKLLQTFLGKPVSFQKGYTQISAPNTPEKKTMTLGHSFIIGNTTETLPKLTFEIKDVKENEVINFLESGSTNKFIREYLNYLTPIEYEIQINFLTNRTESISNFGFLGYSSILNN